MTLKEQNKILDAKIESNINQYKVDRLNAEISAFSSGDLNKYEFLTRKDLKYKPNALDKAKFEFSPLGKAFRVGLDKTSQGYKEEGAIKLLKDIRDSLAGVVIRPNRPDNDDNDDNNRPDNDDNNRPDNDDNNRHDNEKEIVITNLLNEINKLNDTINSINEENDNYFKKIKEQNDDIKKLKKQTMDNKKITKDTLNDAGKKINKFYQEKSKYHNELKYEIERNSEIIKQRNDIFREIARHTRNDLSDKQISKNVLNRDIERLINLNHEYIDKIKYLDDLNEKKFNKKNKYKKNINELKDNLSNEKNVRKELNKLYEDLKRDNSELSFEFEGTKTINQILKKNIKAKEEIIKESTDYVEKYNDLSLKFDDAEITNKMLEKK